MVILSDRVKVLFLHFVTALCLVLAIVLAIGGFIVANRIAPGFGDGLVVFVSSLFVGIGMVLLALKAEIRIVKIKEEKAVIVAPDIIGSDSWGKGGGPGTII